MYIIPIVIISLLSTGVLIFILYGLGRIPLFFMKLPAKIFVFLPRQTEDRKLVWLQWVYAFRTSSYGDQIFGIAREYVDIPEDDMKITLAMNKVKVR